MGGDVVWRRRHYRVKRDKVRKKQSPLSSPAFENGIMTSRVAALSSDGLLHVFRIPNHLRRGGLLSKVPGTFFFSVLDNGVTSLEFWRIVDVAEDLSWAVFYYSGAASAAGQVSSQPNPPHRPRCIQVSHRCQIHSGRETTALAGRWPLCRLDRGFSGTLPLRPRLALRDSPDVRPHTRWMSSQLFSLSARSLSNVETRSVRRRTPGRSFARRTGTGRPRSICRASRRR